MYISDLDYADLCYMLPALDHPHRTWSCWDGNHNPWLCGWSHAFSACFIEEGQVQVPLESCTDPLSQTVSQWVACGLKIHPPECLLQMCACSQLYPDTVWLTLILRGSCQLYHQTSVWGNSHWVHPLPHLWSLQASKGFEKVWKEELVQFHSKEWCVNHVWQIYCLHAECAWIGCLYFMYDLHRLWSTYSPDMAIVLSLW